MVSTSCRETYQIPLFCFIELGLATKQVLVIVSTIGYIIEMNWHELLNEWRSLCNVRCVTETGECYLNSAAEVQVLVSSG